MDRTTKQRVSLWILLDLCWKWWILSFPENVSALPMPVCEAFSSESSQATLKVVKQLQQQSRISKVAITLETRQRLEDSPSHMTLATLSTKCFKSVQHKLLSKSTTLKWEGFLFRKMHDYWHRHIGRCTPTPPYFCDFSYLFYLSYAMMVSKLCMIRFKAVSVRY